MTPELEPCPFCGGQPIVLRHLKNEEHFSDKYSVVCEYTGSENGCGAEGQWNKSEELAIAAWNTRTTPSDKSGCVSVSELEKILSSSNELSQDIQHLIRKAKGTA